MTPTRRLLHFVLPLLIAQAPLAMAADEPPGPSTSGHITEIVLERTECDGPCPVDTLVLHANGKAEYTGRKNTSLTGQFAGSIPKQNFDVLAQWLVAEGFFQLQGRYGDYGNDMSSEVFQVTRGGVRKSVTNTSRKYPLELWGIGKVIRAIAAEIWWQPTHSGIRGLLLQKPPGQDWHPLPGQNIWVTPAGARDRHAFNADHEGYFEINLAPGTYSVGSGFGLPQTVVVEPDRFSEVNLRIDFASASAASPSNYPPPLPSDASDGLYLADSLAAKWMIVTDTEIYRLSDRIEPVFLEKQLVSEGPDNSTFRLALTLPADEKYTLAFLNSLYLVVGDTILRPGIVTGQEGSSVIYLIPGEVRAKEVARIFDVPMVYFSRPDYTLSISFMPTKQSFKRGEPVTATVRIVNDSTSHIQFTNPKSLGAHDDYTFTARKGDQPITDFSFAGDRGGTTSLQGLRPGETLVDTVNLGKWFEFNEAGSYEIHGSYRLSIHDLRYIRIGLTSWTEYAETDFVVVIE